MSKFSEGDLVLYSGQSEDQVVNEKHIGWKGQVIKTFPRNSQNVRVRWDADDTITTPHVTNLLPFPKVGDTVETDSFQTLKVAYVTDAIVRGESATDWFYVGLNKIISVTPARVTETRDLDTPEKGRAFAREVLLSVVDLLRQYDESDLGNEEYLQIDYANAVSYLARRLNPNGAFNLSEIGILSSECEGYDSVRLWDKSDAPDQYCKTCDGDGCLDATYQLRGEEQCIEIECPECLGSGEQA